jgi:hypothetical protein
MMRKKGIDKYETAIMAFEIAMTIIKTGVIVPEIAPLISILPGISHMGAMIKIARQIAGAIIRGSSSSDCRRMLFFGAKV